MIQGTGKGCGSSADGVMRRVIGMKVADNGCGSSWDEIIGMKGVVLVGDGVTGRG